jgi:hypothetical protein
MHALQPFRPIVTSVQPSSRLRRRSGATPGAVPPLVSFMELPIQSV